MTSNSKRKEEKDWGMEADLSPFKRLRINVPGTQISQERMSKYKKEAVKNLRKQVIQARNLQTKRKTTCDSVVKISLIPDEQKRTRYSTKMVVDSNNPVYDDKISFELLQDDISKRLMISVWHIDQSNYAKDYLGSMSFGVLHLMKPNRCVDGWYHLLNEKVGRNKHLLVAGKLTPDLQMRGLHGIPLINKDLWGMESLIISVDRGKSGYGFSVVDGCPVRVSRVDAASPAAEAGLKINDRIAKVNGKNVSRSIAVSVAKLVKNSKYKVSLDIQRPMSYENLEKSPWRWKGKTDDDDDRAEDEGNTQNGSSEQNAAKENEVSVDEDVMLGNGYKMATSTPFPGKLDRKIFHLTKPDTSESRAAAIQQLVDLEREYIDFMHGGIEQYSRPLRHCILSQKQHTELFQNIEKLVTLSEYLLKQLQYNAPSCSSTETDDTSETDSNIIHNIGLIYKSKLQMIYQAYKVYAQGLGQANTVLKDLQNNANFKMFLKECVSAVKQTSISAFITRPSQHVKEMYQTLREIFCNTPQEDSDYLNLKLVVEGLQLCATYITNYTCIRAQKLASSSSSSSHSSSMSNSSLSSYTNSSHSGVSSAVFDGNPSERLKSSVCAVSVSRDFHYEGKLQVSNTVCVKKEQASISYIRNLKPSKSNLGQTSSNCSEDSGHSVDSQLSSIQKKLYFPSTVPYFQLCQEERHLIYSGEIFRWDGDVWNKLQLMLFSDLLLQTEKSTDGRLTVVESPLMLYSLQGIESQRKHATDFLLHVMCSSDKSLASLKKLMFRAPNIEQKYTWKTLIEQRILTYRSGSLESFITSDISGASGVIV
ncbi:Regulator of G-protein signaling 3 [Octopus vulgaris]|uniref:Regulator of G-protein signaling 3 n=1 Tax=Octopus vulgaris TaxID=6645 RepID=A0AA36AJE1_OCTVU|nr:Regulator of G-protein signaling 3 [Octopus vulgaris]